MISRRMFLALIGIPIGAGCSIRFNGSLSGSDAIEEAFINVVTAGLPDEEEAEPTEKTEEEEADPEVDIDLFHVQWERSLLYRQSY